MRAKRLMKNDRAVARKEIIDIIIFGAVLHAAWAQQMSRRWRSASVILPRYGQWQARSVSGLYQQQSRITVA